MSAEPSPAAAPAAANDSAPDESQKGAECPFCVMMRKGGCEVPFKAFMDCGEAADKSNKDMGDCLPMYEALHACMDKNKAVFDALLAEMKAEEAARGGEGEEGRASGSGSGGGGEAGTAVAGSSGAAAAGSATAAAVDESGAGAGSGGSGSSQTPGRG